MTRLTLQEREDDSVKSWRLSIDALREVNTRSKQIAPRPGDATELRWASEGPVKPSCLDTVRGRK